MMAAWLRTHPRTRRSLIATTLLLAMLAAAMWWLVAPIFGAASAAESDAAVGISKVVGVDWHPERNEPLFIAVLGSDTRNGPPGGSGRCDAIHIVAINPELGAGTVINIPRDSNIAGYTKVNAACVNGPEPMVQALASHTGLPIHYYVTTEFSNFVKMIDSLGGVEVDVPYAMADSPSGAFFSAGPQLLGGRQSLAFTRNRKDTPRGDFSRTDNQGIYIIAAAAKFAAETREDPHRVFNYIQAARRYIKTDIPLDEAIELALLARDVDAGKLVNKTVPGSTGSVGAASVVFLAPGDLYSRVRDDAIYDDLPAVPEVAEPEVTETEVAEPELTEPEPVPPVDEDDPDA